MMPFPFIKMAMVPILMAWVALSGLSEVKQAGEWIEGWHGEYRYQGLVFYEPSQFGINEGRTSKLWIWNKDNKEIVGYDRGWDIKPKEFTDKLAYYEIVNILEKKFTPKKQNKKNWGP